MDVPFDVRAWQPTGNVCGHVDVASLSVQLSTNTKDIIRRPYNPSKWVDRARTLGKLCYPELAVGDYWKAGELCRRMLQHLFADNGQWRLGLNRGFWMRAEDGEINADDIMKWRLELIERLEDMMAKTYDESWPYLSKDPSVFEGYHLRRPFPWMSERHRFRDDVLVDHINLEIAANRVSLQRGAPLCEVRRHALESSATSKDNSEVLGLFASQSIERRQVILLDRTDVWGCNGPSDVGESPRHRIDGCCNEIAIEVRGKRVQLDLQAIRDRCCSDTRDTLLLCRFLLIILRDLPTTHPLEHPLVARLTPMYRRKNRHTFSREEDIAIPLMALQECGVDIYADAGGIYDTWVLFELDARIANNRCGTPNSSKLFPLFSLFNHSCEPNVDWTCSRFSRDLIVTAKRHIEKGEQLFVDYDGFAMDASLEERRKSLRAWLDGPCRCSRCLREEREQEKAATAGAMRNFATTDNHPDFRVDNVHSWDTDEKPVLPEDLCSKKTGSCGST